MKKPFIRILPLTVLTVAGMEVQAAGRPNIIYILTDDHGYTDIGARGLDSNLWTPNLDALATNGVLFTDAYCTAPQCSPSRAGIMTGRYQNRFGFLDNGDTPMQLLDPSGEPIVTIAERIQAMGYRTGQVGKWHLKPDANSIPGWPGVAEDYYPDHRGFTDQFEGYTTSYIANFDLNGNSFTRKTLTFSADQHRIDIQTDAARAFIQRAQDRSEPFFLYLAYYAPHVPRLTDTNYYANFPSVDYPQFDVAGDDIRRQGLAIIKAVDTGVGRVMQKLRDLNIETNTVIMFASDNGAPLGTQPDGTRNTNTWNGSENQPLRGEKGSTWEGGIRIPMIMYWKNHLPAGLVYSNTVMTLDLSATAVELAGTNLPSAGYDGVNLLPYLTGAISGVPHENLFWNYGITTWGYTVNVRHGDWKLHQFSDKNFLFNIASDPEETINLADAMPMKLAELSQLTDSYLAGLPTNGVAALRAVELATGDVVYQAPIGTTAYSDTDGDGMSNLDEPVCGRNPTNASDLAFEFGIPGYLERWMPTNLPAYFVTNGFLTGQSTNNQGQFNYTNFYFASSNINNVIVRLKSPIATGLTFRWGNTVSNTFAQSRTITVAYTSNAWQTVVIPMKGYSEWDGATITRMRLNPANTLSDFEVDWIRGSAGDLDADFLPDAYEWTNGLDAANVADGHADGDRDGMTRGQEYIAGTDDGNPASKFSILPIESNSAFRFRWDGKAGRMYSVWIAPQLINPVWMPVTNFSVLGADQPVEFTSAGNDGSCFYQVKVMKP
jgi:arylsulfatase A-like enzyme